MNCNYLHLLVAVALLGSVLATPMMYKKNDKDIYEADLIAVSSTVIPLAEYKVSAGIVDPTLKQLYKKHFHKKADSNLKSDTLITVKNNPKKL